MAVSPNGPKRPYNSIHMLNRLIIKEVTTFPDDVIPGFLYFSRRFNSAIHSCCCGCGGRVITPISKMDWKLIETEEGPSLFPSVGNWNLPCRSHYWIKRGRVIPSSSWSNERIEDASLLETRQRQTYGTHPIKDDKFWVRLREYLKKFVFK